jgi:hypothetical protein
MGVSGLCSFAFWPRFHFTLPNSLQCRSQEDIVRLLVDQPRLRLFPFGIGASPDRHYLRVLARTSGGLADFTGPNPLSKIRRLARRVFAAALQNVDISWSGAEVDQAPRLVPSLLSGERTIIYAFLPAAVRSVSISSRSPSETFVVRSSLMETRKGRLVHRLAARRAIEDWDAGLMAANPIADELLKSALAGTIVALSVQHSVLCRLTSFIAVEDRTVASDSPVQPFSQIAGSFPVDELGHMEFQKRAISSAADGESSLFTYIVLTDDEETIARPDPDETPLPDSRHSLRQFCSAVARAGPGYGLVGSYTRHPNSSDWSGPELPPTAALFIGSTGNWKRIYRQISDARLSSGRFLKLIDERVRLEFVRYIPEERTEWPEAARTAASKLASLSHFYSVRADFLADFHSLCEVMMAEAADVSLPPSSVLSLVRDSPHEFYRCINTSSTLYQNMSDYPPTPLQSLSLRSARFFCLFCRVYPSIDSAALVEVSSNLLIESGNFFRRVGCLLSFHLSCQLTLLRRFQRRRVSLLFTSNVMDLEAANESLSTVCSESRVPHSERLGATTVVSEGTLEAIVSALRRRAPAREAKGGGGRGKGKIKSRSTSRRVAWSADNDESDSDGDYGDVWGNLRASNNSVAMNGPVSGKKKMGKKKKANFSYGGKPVKLSRRERSAFQAGNAVGSNPLHSQNGGWKNNAISDNYTPTTPSKSSYSSAVAKHEEEAKPKSQKNARRDSWNVDYDKSDKKSHKGMKDMKKEAKKMEPPASRGPPPPPPPPPPSSPASPPAPSPMKYPQSQAQSEVLSPLRKKSEKAKERDYEKTKEKVKADWASARASSPAGRGFAIEYVPTVFDKYLALLTPSFSAVVDISAMEVEMAAQGRYRAEAYSSKAKKSAGYGGGGCFVWCIICAVCIVLTLVLGFGLGFGLRGEDDASSNASSSS